MSLISEELTYDVKTEWNKRKGIFDVFVPISGMVYEIRVEGMDKGREFTVNFNDCFDLSYFSQNCMSKNGVLKFSKELMETNIVKSANRIDEYIANEPLLKNTPENFVNMSRINRIFLDFERYGNSPYEPEDINRVQNIRVITKVYNIRLKNSQGVEYNKYVY